MKVGILAGGLSSRYGKDKATEILNGLTFLDHLYNELSIDFNTIISVGNKKYNDNYKYIEDEIKNIGPIEGIRQLLKNCTDEYMAIVSVDTPFIRREMIHYLQEFVSSDYDVYVYIDKGKIHPLCGIYSIKVVDKIEEAIAANNYSVTRLISGLRTKYIDINMSKFSPRLLSNINKREDYEKYIKKDNNIIAISGQKNSGKTTLICRLIPYLKKNFNNIGIIKHDGHDYEIDHVGTDTYKYRLAGANNIGIISEYKSCILKYESSNFQELLKTMSGCDLIILEGFKDSDYKKIEVYRKENNKSLVCSKNVIAIVTDYMDIETKYTKIGINSIEKIASCIIDNVH